MTTTRPLLNAALLVAFILLLLPQQYAAITQADAPPFQSDLYPRCTQASLTSPLTGLDEANYDHHLYLPLIFKAPDPPSPCTVYCGLALADDPYRPAGYQTYLERTPYRLGGYLCRATSHPAPLTAECEASLWDNRPQLY